MKKKSPSKLEALLNSPDGIAAMGYLLRTSEEQEDVLRGAGVSPVGLVDSLDLQSDIESESGLGNRSSELYRRLGEHAEKLSQYAAALLEIANAGTRLHTP